MNMSSIFLQPPVTLPLQESVEVEEYVPPVPKKWISLGSEIEIDNERTVLNRPLVGEQIRLVDHDRMQEQRRIVSISTLETLASEITYRQVQNIDTEREIQRCRS
jgi:hypothetical protein